MSDKQKTPMQELLQVLREERDKLDPCKTEEFQRFQTLNFAISEGFKLLPVERKSYIEYGERCFFQGARLTDETKSKLRAEIIFNQKYGTDETTNNK